LVVALAVHLRTTKVSDVSQQVRVPGYAQDERLQVLDGMNRMDRMCCGSPETRDHPVNPVHPVRRERCGSCPGSLAFR